MSKRLFISFAPLLAIAAFLVMPALAQAAAEPSPIVEKIQCELPGNDGAQCNNAELGKHAGGPEGGGTKVIITGKNFLPGAMAVGPPTIPGSLEVTVTAEPNTTEILATVKGTFNGPFKVEVANGNPGDTCVPQPGCRTNAAQSASGFPNVFYQYGPAVVSITPNRGSIAGGEAVTVKGFGFRKGESTVTLGGKLLTGIVVVDEETITGTTPAAATPGPAEVNATTGAGEGIKGFKGTSKSGQQFIYESAAAGTPRYYRNGSKEAARLEATGSHVGVVAWGTLSLTNTKGGSGGKVECHNVIGGWIENPGSGAAGIGDTQSFNPYECESAACTAAATGGGPLTYISVLAEPTPYNPETGELGGTLTDLGWKSKLIFEESTKLIRAETVYAKVNVICHIMTGFSPTKGPEFLVNLEEVSEGPNRPSSGPFHNKATAPPETVFDTKGAGSGELHGPPGEAGRTGKTEGVLKALGYAEEETINTKMADTP